MFANAQNLLTNLSAEIQETDPIPEDVEEQKSAERQCSIRKNHAIRYSIILALLLIAFYEIAYTIWQQLQGSTTDTSLRRTMQSKEQESIQNV
ncbi:MAG TPA: hypothetical protein EYG35_01310 [Gammaproteobacteria bacterium]|nr:hypothetical protein [Gammaproteobacteria bacterium]